MLVQIGVRAPDFHDPLGLLGASLMRLHARVRALAFAGTALPWARGEVRQQALAGLEEAVAFFEQNGEDHFRDEEESLFPRLRAQVGQRDPLRPALVDLADDHRACRALQQHAVELGHQVLTGQADDQALAALAGVAQALGERYAAHLTLAEEQVLPRARELLGPEELDAMGQEMARRRGNQEAVGTDAPHPSAAPGLP